MKRTLVCLSIAAAALCGAPARAGSITPELAAQMARHKADERIPVIVELADRVDPLPFRVADRRRRDTRLMRALKAKSERALALLKPRLDQAGAAGRKPLWIDNAIAVTLPVAALDALARLPEVARIQFDATVRLAAFGGQAGATGGAGWNLDALHVPELWALGARGAGVVVANMDTGVDLAHPDLESRWRGGANSWFDPYRQYPLPSDANGHGTQTMGLLVGGDAGGSPIGVAPDARWIAARIFDDAGQSTLSTIHQAFQWLLDPDADPATVDAPDVVNASWGLTGGALGACNMEFNNDIAVLASAGIAVVFAAGNDGPAPSSGASPAANPAAFSAGSVTAELSVASDSSRGPSGCDGTIFPKVAAPGVNVTSSDLSFGGLPLYATVSGTSFAAPHVAGTLALLASAFPAADVKALANALTDSATDIDAAGADNSAGYGLVDALAARQLLADGGAGGHTPVITSLPVTDALLNQPWQYQMSATDADGGVLRYALAQGPAGMAVDASTGLVRWTPGPDQAGANPVTVTVTDPTARADAQSFSILVAAPNRAPVAANDSYTMAAGASLEVAMPGVLANDGDADGDALAAQLAAAPAHGTLALDANGGFRYLPGAAYAGTDSFSYRASDGKAASATATVSISVVAPAPVARNDSFSAPVYGGGWYAARRLAVLANDSAGAGAALAPSTLALASAPNKGGKVLVNGDGTVSYTPPLRFAGVESFKYKVRDSRGLWSGIATVSVTVK